MCFQRSRHRQPGRKRKEPAHHRYFDMGKHRQQSRIQNKSKRNHRIHQCRIQTQPLRTGLCTDHPRERGSRKHTLCSHSRQHHHHHKKQKNGADGSAQDDIAFSLGGVHGRLLSSLALRDSPRRVRARTGSSSHRYNRVSVRSSAMRCSARTG